MEFLDEKFWSLHSISHRVRAIIFMQILTYANCVQSGNWVRQMALARGCNVFHHTHSASCCFPETAHDKMESTT